jgi:transposase
MDNACIHHKVLQTLDGFGVLVYFLSPYSPDLNPIEEAFSEVKIFK